MTESLENAVLIFRKGTFSLHAAIMYEFVTIMCYLEDFFQKNKIPPGTFFK